VRVLGDRRPFIGVMLLSGRAIGDVAPTLIVQASAICCNGYRQLSVRLEGTVASDTSGMMRLAASGTDC